MRRDHHRDLEIARQLGEQVVQPLAVRVIEIARRLVGESTTGSIASARATAVRCCSPPDSCDRPVLHPPAESDARQQSSARALRAGRRPIRRCGAASSRSRAP